MLLIDTWWRLLWIHNFKGNSKYNAEIFVCSFFYEICNTKFYLLIVTIIIPPWTKFREIYRKNSACPSVCADSCPAHNFYFGLTLAYHIWHMVVSHKKMCRIHSWSRYDLELWCKGQIYGVLTCFRVRPIIIFWFDIGLPYLAHGSITMKRCDTYIDVPDSMLTFDLKIK